MKGFQRHENYFKGSAKIKTLRNIDLKESHLKTIRMWLKKKKKFFKFPKFNILTKFSYLKGLKSKTSGSI